MIVILSNCFYQVCSPLFCLLKHIGWDVNFIKGHSLCFHVPDDSFHFDKVNYTFEIIFGANRQLQGNSF